MQCKLSPINYSSGSIISRFLTAMGIMLLGAVVFVLITLAAKQNESAAEDGIYDRIQDLSDDI